MTLVQEIYENQDEAKLTEVWRKFPLFSPGLGFVKRKSIKTALKNGDEKYLITQLRRNFFPHLTYHGIQEAFRQAMNRGGKTLNDLCRQHLGEEAQQFLTEEIPGPLDLFAFLNSARCLWGKTRNGKHLDTFERSDFEKIRSAYEIVRSWGLGSKVLMIDRDPGVRGAIGNHQRAGGWVNDLFEFYNPTQANGEKSLFRWQTTAGIDVYGTAESPFSSRVKVLTKDNELNYGSILMKMARKRKYLGAVHDHTGVELVVEDDEALDKMGSHFRNAVRGIGKIEQIKL